MNHCSLKGRKKSWTINLPTLLASNQISQQDLSWDIYKLIQGVSPLSCQSAGNWKSWPADDHVLHASCHGCGLSMALSRWGCQLAWADWHAAFALRCSGRGPAPLPHRGVWVVFWSRQRSVLTLSSLVMGDHKVTVKLGICHAYYQTIATQVILISLGLISLTCWSKAIALDYPCSSASSFAVINWLPQHVQSLALSAFDQCNASSTMAAIDTYAVCHVSCKLRYFDTHVLAAGVTDCLLAALMAAIAFVAIRFIPKTESSLSIALSFHTMGVITSAIPLAVWPPATPILHSTYPWNAALGLSHSAWSGVKPSLKALQAHQHTFLSCLISSKAHKLHVNWYPMGVC